MRKRKRGSIFMATIKQLHFIKISVKYLNES